MIYGKSISQAITDDLEGMCSECRAVCGHAAGCPEEIWKEHMAAVKRTPLKIIPDDPEADGTDFAHPAWWRGYEHSCRTFCQLVTEILDGKDDGRGANYEPWGTVRQRLVKLVKERVT